MRKIEYYNEIKDRLIDVEVTCRVKDYTKNKVMLENYYEIGRLIVEAQGGKDRNTYGNKLIKDYANRLTSDLGRGYSWRNLYNMRSYYNLFSNNEILHSMNAKLDWSHYKELLVIKNVNAIKYYIDISIKQNLTYRELKKRIKSKEYEKLSEETKNKLISGEKIELIELVKDPIVINNPNDIEVITEKTLQKLIMEDIFSFLKQLGNDYMFVGNEYPIKLGNNYNYIDLLLYNKEYSSYIVIELKIVNLKKQDIGQIEVYMNYIDKNIRDTTDNKTIGIILCHKNNKLIIEYCSNPNITSREYILS